MHPTINPQEPILLEFDNLLASTLPLVLCEFNMVDQCPDAPDLDLHLVAQLQEPGRLQPVSNSCK